MKLSDRGMLLWRVRLNFAIGETGDINGTIKIGNRRQNKYIKSTLK